MHVKRVVAQLKVFFTSKIVQHFIIFIAKDRIFGIGKRRGVCEHLSEKVSIEIMQFNTINPSGKGESVLHSTSAVY